LCFSRRIFSAGPETRRLCERLAPEDGSVCPMRLSGETQLAAAGATVFGPGEYYVRYVGV